jgi:hypothetical protein
LENKELGRRNLPLLSSRKTCFGFFWEAVRASGFKNKQLELLDREVLRMNYWGKMNNYRRGCKKKVGGV